MLVSIIGNPVATLSVSPEVGSRQCTLEMFVMKQGGRNNYVDPYESAVEQRLAEDSAHETQKTKHEQNEI